MTRLRPVLVTALVASLGFLPMAIVNYLARLGHYYGHDQFLSIDELGVQFKVEALAKSPAKFNEQQLLFWQSLFSLY